jgi:uncharacterized membrane protein YoaK (UPF0700 family)
VLTHASRLRVFAVSLSLLAGTVDAFGFISLHGLFVSFMSGNSTQLGVGLAGGPGGAGFAAALIPSFVLGVVAGTLVARAWPARRRSALLALVCLLLALAALLASRAVPHASALAMTLAMGAENVSFAGDGEVNTGVTYMTGTLVKFGQSLVAAVSGDDRFGWVFHLVLWLALVLGAALGAMLFVRLGPGGLWLAAGAALLLGLAAWRLDGKRAAS